MGMVFTGIGGFFFYSQLVKAPAERVRRRRLEALHPGQPWMLRRDWAARRVTDSGLGTMIFMWVWVASWWGAIVFIWSMNRDKILAAAATSWWEAAFGIIFVLCGLAGLWMAIHVTRTHLRYGRSVLRIDTLPGRLGDTFRGTLEANFRTQPAALEAVIACEYVRWVTHRRNGKTTREQVREPVWSGTHPLDTARMLLAGGTTAATLAVNVPLPADQPSCALDGNGDGIVWRLTVREPTDDIGRRKGGAGTGGDEAGGSDAGPLYSATFEVPVFGR